MSRRSPSARWIAARTEEQLTDNLNAVKLNLFDDEVAEIEAVSRPNLPYPLWHQAANASDRLSAADRAALS